MEISYHKIGSGNNEVGNRSLVSISRNVFNRELAGINNVTSFTLKWQTDNCETRNTHTVIGYDLSKIGLF